MRKLPRVLAATTWYPIEGMPTYCPFTKRMIEAERLHGIEIDLVRPVPWFRWHQQRLRVSGGGDERYPLSWKPLPGKSSIADARFHAQAVQRAVRSSGRSYGLLHTHGLDANLVMGRIVSEALNIPWIAHAHDTVLPVDDASIDALTHADLVLAVSGHQAALLRETMRGRYANIQVLFNGIPSAFFDAPLSSPKNGEGLKCVFVGRLHPNKGIDWLVANWNRIAIEADSLDIYGVGPLEADLRANVERHGLSSRIRILGGVPNERLPAILTAYDAFVSPTRIETFGIANVEALSVGLPLLVTDLPVTREILGNLQGVRFRRLEDEAGYAQALCDLRENQPDNKAIREGVRDYDMRNTIGRLSEYYHETMVRARDDARLAKRGQR